MVGDAAVVTQDTLKLSSGRGDARAFRLLRWRRCGSVLRNTERRKTVRYGYPVQQRRGYPFPSRLTPRGSGRSTFLYPPPTRFYSQVMCPSAQICELSGSYLRLLRRYLELLLSSRRGIQSFFGVRDQHQGQASRRRLMMVPPRLRRLLRP